MVIFVVKSLKLIRKLSKVLLDVGLVYKIIKNVNIFLRSRNTYVIFKRLTIKIRYL